MWAINIDTKFCFPTGHHGHLAQPPAVFGYGE